MKKLNSATKYTIVICIGLVIFNLVFSYVLIGQAAKAMRTQINERMLDVTNTAAAMIDGDDLANLTKDDLGSPEYQRVMDILYYFQENTELQYIYSIIQVYEREFVLGVDPTIEEPGAFGAPIFCTDALYNASKGTAGVDRYAYEDEWGKFYSAYTPVFDSKGNVAGIVAADFDAYWYRNRIAQLVFIVIVFMAIALVGSILLPIVIAMQYNKFFNTLSKKMNDLYTGIETLIDEVAPLSGSDDDDMLVMSLDEEKGMRNNMNLLGEKILLMQMRLSKYIEVIRSNAYLDGLTGLNNRTSYMEYRQILEKKISENKDYIFSVVVFDINQLKMINDDFGHDVGDKLIVAISNDIRDVFGSNRVYRVGGDEFVVILDDPDPSAKIQQVKDTIDRKNKESPIFHNPEITIGLSVGYATFDPAVDSTYVDVFNRADNAMYADKREFYKTHVDRRRRG